MKHPRRFIGLSLFAVVIIISAWFLLPGDDGPAGEPLEATENAGGRAEWEWMRLRNPTTGTIPADMRRRELAFSATLPQRESFLYKSGGAEILSAEWTPRGPYNVGGRTRALAVDRSDENTLLAGGASGGMWRSTDGGGSWKRATRPDQHPTASCIAQDIRPGRTSVWYYGSGEFHGSTGSAENARYSGEGIFKSTDGGHTWNVLPSTVIGSPAETDNAFDYVWNIATDPSNAVADELYAAAYGGILRSMDGGNTWQDVLGNFSNKSTFTDVAVTSTGVVYATLSSNGLKKGIWRSPDGVSWTNITPPGWAGTSNRTVIGIAPSDENTVYFLGETPNSGHRVSSQSGTEWHSIWKYTYVSGEGTGAGGTWENRSHNLPAASGQFGGFRSQRSFDLVIAVKPDNPDIVFIGGTNLYRSDDGFKTRTMTRWIGGYKSSFLWMDFSYPNHHPDQHALTFSPTNPSILYSGHDGGISKTLNPAETTDSVRWVSLNNGYLTTQLYALAIDHGTEGDPTIIAGMQDNSSWITGSADGNALWSQIGPGDGAFCAIADGGGALYVSSQYGRIYRVTLDETRTAERWTRIDPTGAPGFLFINPLTLDPSDPRILYHVSGGHLWRNTDPTQIPLDSSANSKSLNWRPVTLSGFSMITAIGVSTSNPAHRVYCGTRDGAVGILDDASSSESDVRRVSTGLPGGYISCIAVDPRDGEQAMVIYANYGIPSIFFTSNGGESWAQVAGNLEQNPDGSGDGPSCRWGTILHVGSETIYFVGTSTGLYSTTELKGTNTVWVREGASTIGNVIVNMVVARQSDGLVAVGTHGNGIFTATLGSSGDVPGDKGGSRLALHESVPNPVRSTSTIGFDLPISGQARLSLHDLNGREVRKLVDATLPAGNHSATLDLRSGEYLPSGRYFYKLEAAGVRRSRGVIVER